MCIVDAMHNLMLGTAKRMVELLKSSQVLNDKKFEEIQAKVDSFVRANEIGHIPSKDSSSFSGFTVQQWKNWTVYFSSYALQGVLPWSHYNCWLHFVKACFHTCRRTITGSNLKFGDQMLMEFCQKFDQTFGGDKYTINMHVHGHLLECIQVFGILQTILTYLSN